MRVFEAEDGWGTREPGNVQVSSITDWFADYSLAPPGDARGSRLLARLMHQLMHVYQMRTLHYNEVYVVAKRAEALAGRGYTYVPLDLNVPFLNLNIEQQAEIVGDLSLLRRRQPPRLVENIDGITDAARLESYLRMSGF
jgi:hypothetical protein